MKASENQQAGLLSLGNLDAEISRAKSTLTELTSGKSTKDMRELNLKLAGELIEARNQLDSVELELKRAETDLQTVEQRIEKDNARLSTTSNSKDAQGIQSELATLTKRKSELEDMELAILEKKDEVAAVFAEVQARKTLNENELREAEAKIEAEVLKQRSGLDLMVQQRAQQSTQLPVELLELYEKKAARGIAIGRLIGRECGACRISLGATAYAEIQALPSDDIATCPDCQAILVR
ncbi:C4-type zinc ribbon domain-containing protein [Rhodoluna sp.]|uniref:zinc ribbon domain-containing protein n=1 Tax=Rhodoluna sp. TaxID=1969481 RepID=UPI0025E95949|nr:C4-type zinc ribbon domain-containing protein [Rhodoluna sp.]